VIQALQKVKALAGKNNTGIAESKSFGR